MYRTLCSATWTQALNWTVDEPLQPAQIWLGWKDYSALRASPLRGRPFGRYPSSANSSSRTTSCRRTAPTVKIWLGWKDSNLRMAGSKPAALPLGDTPVESTISELA